MKSLEKNNDILKITKDELEILSLISLGAFGDKNHLFYEKDCKNPIKIGNLEYTITFSPSLLDLNANLLHNKNNQKLLKLSKNLRLECENKIVGCIKNAEIFENKNTYLSIFNPFECKLQNANFCIGGEIEIYQSDIQEEYKFVKEYAKKIDAKKITALVLDIDPVHRAHELMIRWSIDKADLIVIFITNRENQMDFDLRLEAFLRFVKKYLPSDKIICVKLKQLKFYGLNINPMFECLLVKTFGANKLVITQNHMGVGIFYDHNAPQTKLLEYAKNSEVELIVLPEIVFCTQCQNIVSTKSCPHGNHHHIKYRSDIIKELLYCGLIPPSVLLRSEVSAYLLSHLHKKRFKDINIFNNGLFENGGLIENLSDEEFYNELSHLYRTQFLG